MCVYTWTIFKRQQKPRKRSLWSPLRFPLVPKSLQRRWQEGTCLVIANEHIFLNLWIDDVVIKYTVPILLDKFISVVFFSHFSRMLKSRAGKIKAIFLFRAHTKTPWNSWWPAETSARPSGKSVWSITPFLDSLKNPSRNQSQFSSAEGHRSGSGEGAASRARVIAMWTFSWDSTHHGYCGSQQMNKANHGWVYCQWRHRLAYASLLCVTFRDSVWAFGNDLAIFRSQSNPSISLEMNFLYHLRISHTNTTCFVRTHAHSFPYSSLPSFSFLS